MRAELAVRFGIAIAGVVAVVVLATRGRSDGSAPPAPRVGETRPDAPPRAKRPRKSRDSGDEAVRRPRRATADVDAIDGVPHELRELFELEHPDPSAESDEFGMPEGDDDTSPDDPHPRVVRIPGHAGSEDDFDPPSGDPVFRDDAPLPEGLPAEIREAIERKRAGRGNARAARPGRDAARPDAPAGPVHDSGGEPVDERTGSSGDAVRVVRLIERNLDGFSESLGHHTPGAASLGWRLDAGALFVDPALARTTDVATLATHHVHLDDPTSTIERCRLFVVHVVDFEGSGRSGSWRELYAFRNDEGFVRVPTWEKSALAPDDLRDEPPGIALLAVRLLGPGFRVLVSEGRVYFQGKPLDRSVGEPVAVHRDRRSMRVVEPALRRGDIEWKSGRGASMPEVLSPARDFGEVWFETTVTAVLDPATRLVLRTSEAR